VAPGSYPHDLTSEALARPRRFVLTAKTAARDVPLAIREAVSPFASRRSGPQEARIKWAWTDGCQQPRTPSSLLAVLRTTRVTGMTILDLPLVSSEFLGLDGPLPELLG
jgi:hypothetical protein